MGRSRKLSASCDRLCLLFKSSFSFVSIRRDSVLPPEKVTCKSQSHTHTHRNALHIHLYTHTHTLITTYRCLWSGRLLQVLLEHAASVTGKRERLESHTWAFPSPLRSDTGDTTRVSLPRMSPWGLEIQLFDEYCCLFTSFSRTLESSAASFFSLWRSFWVTALCRDWTWSDPPRVGFEGMLYLAPLAGVSLTPYSTSVCAEGH